MSLAFVLKNLDWIILKPLPAFERILSLEKTYLSQVHETKLFFNSFDHNARRKVYSASCGDGVWELYLSRNYANLIEELHSSDIVDCSIDPSCISEISSTINWHFQKQTVDKVLSYPDNYFDICFHHDVIEHTRRPYHFLREHFRVLRSGGVYFYQHQICLGLVIS